MTMEEKLVINGLEQGIELTKRLMCNFKHTSSTESSKTLISEILRIYQNAILILSCNEDDENIFKRSHVTDERDSENVFKNRKILDKKTEKVYVFVGTGQEKDSVDDGHSWRKYGQKDIHGSINPKGYFRCTHSFEDLKNKKRKNVVRTLSFSDHENVGGGEGEESNVFMENVMKNHLMEESLSSVENSETADSYYSSLDNSIDLGQEDWLWS